MSSDEERLSELYEELEEATRKREDIVSSPYAGLADILQAESDVHVIAEDIEALGGELP